MVNNLLMMSRLRSAESAVSLPLTARVIESSQWLRPEQINVLRRVAQMSRADLFRFRLFVQCNSCKFGHDENARLFIPFLELRNNLSLTECPL